MARVLMIEPYYGGSHKQLIDTLLEDLLTALGDAENPCFKLFSLPAKKWHWKARTSALHFAGAIPEQHNFKALFATSVLNLAELIALRPDLRPLKKILYFHENQLVYPVRKQQERDFQYGYNQIISCLVADIVVFNSVFNMNSFLSSIDSFFKLQPDHRPKDLRAKILPKCRVLYFPVKIPVGLERTSKNLPILHIVWPHRWEHDKGPEILFQALDSLIEHGCCFELSVLGEQFTDVPTVFEEARSRLEASGLCKIINWGYVSRLKFVETLSTADVVVSTSLHEFFGVSMIEAAFLGCYPLCPNRLSYPEIFPRECLYNTETQLVKKLRYFCRYPAAVLTKKLNLELERFTWESLKTEYKELLLG